MRKALVVLCLLVLGACTNDDDPGDPASPDVSAEATATPAPTPCAIEDADTKAKESSNDLAVGLLTDVRPNAEDCPRVVLEFENHVPSYKVEYVDPPITECGSGDEAPVGEWGSDAYISVRLEPASSADLTQENRITYDGPRDFEFDAPVLKHLKKTCDFEAVMEWVIALDSERAFTVDTFDDPPRLVVDVSAS